MSANSEIKKLQEAFPRYREQILEIKGILVSLKATSEIRGIVGSDVNGAETVNLTGDKREPVSAQINLSPEEKVLVLKALDLLKAIGADYTNIEHTEGDNSFQLVMRGGGVLGSSSGYYYVEKGDIAAIGFFKHEKIRNEANWYAFFD